MIVHVLSDVHLEFNRWRKIWPLAELECDLHVLACDIGVGLQGLEWALKLNKPVIYIFGNHEYYGQRTTTRLWEKARAKVKGTHVHLLENESIVIDGVRFVGCTLWTDFCLLGDARLQEMMIYASQVMSDYKNILSSSPFTSQGWLDMPYSTGRSSVKITPRQVLDWHQQSRAYLERELATESNGQWARTIVVTHHAPTEKSLPYGKVTAKYEVAYASNLDDLVPRAVLWIHGHVHEAREYSLQNGGRIVVNCRGYLDSGIHAAAGFKWNKVVEV